jgi:hypothetical protein
VPVKWIDKVLEIALEQCRRAAADEPVPPPHRFPLQPRPVRIDRKH